ncbi:MAG: DNA polymerase III subunit beta [Pirellulales bacterium]
MKITFDRDKFLSSFAVAQSVAPARSPKQILQNVKFEATADGGRFLATDLEIGVRVKVDGIEVHQPGTTVLPVGRFAQVLREARDKQLTLEISGNGAVVKGERFKVKLATESPDEFPAIEEFAEKKFHVIPAPLLRSIIQRTAFATDNESSRYALGGVLMEMTDDKIIAVGTDGRRLAKMEGPAQAVEGHRTGDQGSIIPTRALQLIDRAIGDEGDVKVAARGNDVMVQNDRLTLFTRLVEGRFPKWRDVLPNRPQASRIPLPVGQLLEAVRQAAVVTSDESRGVDFHFGDGKLRLNANTAQVGESESSLIIAYDGSELGITLDPRFLVDFLKVLPGESTITFEAVDGTGPAVLTTDDGYSYVIMPLSRDR